ncbi:hypothetical protein OHA45_24260 [Streptomyces lydicus]|uniref:hypothetical protein n=1 Tax=Streptomyces lydicus TaxID=47763 RepID=UPI002E30C945|nr:hypothetical protein [Streptomyces lydicus]
MTATADALYATHQGYVDQDSNLPDNWKPGGSEVFQLHGSSNIGTPVLPQGNGLWMIEGDPWYAVNAVSAQDGSPVWEYKVGKADRQWLVADGNRVFVLNGDALYALPVF